MHILDINDHAPIFSQRQYSASVVENLPLLPPAPILQLTAHDADTGDNAVIAYTITAGDEQGAKEGRIEMQYIEWDLCGLFHGVAAVQYFCVGNGRVLILI